MQNINDEVWFYLTKTGTNAYNARHVSFYESHQNYKKPDDKKEYDIVKMQLWDVMSTFGPHTYMGNDVFCHMCRLYESEKELLDAWPEHEELIIKWQN